MIVVHSSSFKNIFFGATYARFCLTPLPPIFEQYYCYAAGPIDRTHCRNLTYNGGHVAKLFSYRSLSCLLCDFFLFYLLLITSILELLNSGWRDPAFFLLCHCKLFPIYLKSLISLFINFAYLSNYTNIVFILNYLCLILLRS